LVGADLRRQKIAPARPGRTTHFEDVNEVRAEFERETGFDSGTPIVGDFAALMTAPLPQKDRPGNMQGALRHEELVTIIQIGILEIDEKLGVILLDGGA